MAGREILCKIAPVNLNSADGGKSVGRGRSVRPENTSDGRRGRTRSPRSIRNLAHSVALRVEKALCEPRIKVTEETTSPRRREMRICDILPRRNEFTRRTENLFKTDLRSVPVAGGFTAKIAGGFISAARLIKRRKLLGILKLINLIGGIFLWDGIFRGRRKWILRACGK